MAVWLTLGGGIAQAQNSNAPPACGGHIAKGASAGDPCGDNTGTHADITGADPNTGAVTPAQVADQVGHNRISINIVWTLVTGFLVMFMQAGFALVETGFCRKKNAAHVMMTNFMIYGIGIIGFWLVGYALMFGGVGHIAQLGGTNPLNHEITARGWGLFGWKGFGFNGIYDVGVAAHFLFNLVFMDTTATIVTGAMAERWKFSAFCVYGFWVSMIIYPLYGNWTWGGGWMAQMGTKWNLGHGYVDFAGSGVVHAIGGFTALGGAMVLGPRIGKYNKDGSSNTLPGHNLPMAMLGCFILAFGWFGFNPGSTLAGTDLRIAIVAVNTMLASATGAFCAMLWAWNRKPFNKPDPGMAVNGMLAGLVAITAPSGFVAPWAALLIGAVAGVLVIESVLFFDRMHVDDPVGAISVHGTCGLWGLISLGLFADGTYSSGGWNGVPGTVKGLFYGDGGQLVAEIIGCIVILIWAWGGGYLFFKVQHKIMGIRSKPEDELAGLDLPEMGALAYPYDPPWSENGHVPVLVGAPAGAPAGAGESPPLT
ncbi:MAG TPA: ammonium transporter [Acidimicrobiales bacterium]|nr:ammonium transporter [Acidimicrobiales bacterium]